MIRKTHAFLNQSEVKLKLTASWSLPFLARQAVGIFFSLIFHWLLSSVVLIGCCDFFLYDSLQHSIWKYSDRSSQSKWVTGNVYFDLSFCHSGVELPDARAYDGPEPRKISGERRLWICPETCCYERRYKHINEFYHLSMLSITAFVYYTFSQAVLYHANWNFLIYFVAEIAYFNPSTKDVIPGVSPQILQIKVQKSILLITISSYHRFFEKMSIPDFVTWIWALFSSVQVISGQQFPKPKGSTAKGDVSKCPGYCIHGSFISTKASFNSSQVIDPFVTIEVFGIPADIAQDRTRTVPHNGRWFTHLSGVFDYQHWKTKKLTLFTCHQIFKSVCGNL